jgi:hypothetical protein
MITDTIPCTDCAEARERLERQGATVHGCSPIAQRPGMCRLRWEPAPATAAPAAAAAAATNAPDPVAAQLAAYNAQDLDAFCACYHDDIVVEKGDGSVVTRGMADFRARYLALFARFPQNHAALVSRMRIGPWVVDEEQVTGRGGPPLRAVAVYRLRGGRIASVRFLSADD